MSISAFKFIPLLLFTSLCFSQNKKMVNQDNFDSIARTKTYKGDLKLLVSQLTENSNSETDKARAIFVWLTDNIAYDYKAFNKHKLPQRPKSKKGKNYNDIVAQWKIDYTDRVLRKGKAVCEGYSMLFKRMCDYAGLQTDYIPGYVKDMPNQIGRMGTNDHAWNGIVIDGKYYFLDATWAAGGCTTNKKGKLNGFVKRFNDFYWLTPTEKFCVNHYPEDKENPGVANYPVEKYKNNPYIAKSRIQYTNIITPTSGIIEAKLGEIITFSFESLVAAEEIAVSTNTKHLKTILLDKTEASKHLDYNTESPTIPFAKTDNTYTFQYVLTNKNTRYIEIYFNSKLFLRFNIKIVQ